MTPKIEKLILAVEKANDALVAALKREYPVGTKVIYKLRGGKDAHRYPEQEGQIVGHTDNGRLLVKLAESRSARYMGRTDRHVETLPPAKIIRKVRPI